MLSSLIFTVAVVITIAVIVVVVLCDGIFGVCVCFYRVDDRANRGRPMHFSLHFVCICLKWRCSMFLFVCVCALVSVPNEVSVCLYVCVACFTVLCFCAFLQSKEPRIAKYTNYIAKTHRTTTHTFMYFPKSWMDIRLCLAVYITGYISKHSLYKIEKNGWHRPFVPPT